MKEWPPALRNTDVNAEHWEYHAEGAANIVVRYVGPNIWPFYNAHGNGEFMALRIPKVVNDKEAQHMPYADKFLSNVITHLLPAWSLPCMRRIDTDDTWYDFLATLAQKCEQHRPTARLNSHMDTKSSYIWVIRDDSRPPLHSHSRIVIEIKVCVPIHAYCSLSADLYLVCPQPVFHANNVYLSINYRNCTSYLNMGAMAATTY